MYPLLAILAAVVGICLFAFANRMTKNCTVNIGVKILGIALVVVGISMSYLLISGKVVLPLSKGCQLPIYRADM